MDQEILLDSDGNVVLKADTADVTVPDDGVICGCYKKSRRCSNDAEFPYALHIDDIVYGEVYLVTYGDISICVYFDMEDPTQCEGTPWLSGSPTGKTCEECVTEDEMCDECIDEDCDDCPDPTEDDACPEDDCDYPEVLTLTGERKVGAGAWVPFTMTMVGGGCSHTWDGMGGMAGWPVDAFTSPAAGPYGCWGIDFLDCVVGSLTYLGAYDHGGGVGCPPGVDYQNVSLS